MSRFILVSSLNLQGSAGSAGFASSTARFGERFGEADTKDRFIISSIHVALEAASLQLMYGENECQFFNNVRDVELPGFKWRGIIEVEELDIAI